MGRAAKSLMTAGLKGHHHLVLMPSQHRQDCFVAIMLTLPSGIRAIAFDSTWLRSGQASITVTTTTAAKLGQQGLRLLHSAILAEAWPELATTAGY